MTVLILALIAYWILAFILNQFKRLFEEPSAVTASGWLVITLLFMIFGIFTVRFARSLSKTLSMKKAYDNSLYFRKTKRPFNKTKKQPGAFFEYEVSKALEARFPSMDQWVNPVFKRKDAVNEYAEVDIVCFHPTGIYLIECKDYDGYVYGSLKSTYWTVGYEHSGTNKTYEFQNPLTQNKTHIKDLRAHVEATYHNIVMFSKRTTLDTDIPAIHTVESLEKAIHENPEIYSETALESIKDSLNAIRSDDARSDHIKRIGFNNVKYS